MPRHWWISAALFLLGCRTGTLDGTIVVGNKPAAGVTVSIASEKDIVPYLDAVRATKAPIFEALRQDYLDANRAMVGRAFERVEPRILARIGDIEIQEAIRTEDTAYWYYTYDPSKHTEREAQQLVEKALLEKGETNRGGFPAFQPLQKTGNSIDHRPRVAASRRHLEDWEANAFADFPAAPGDTTATDGAGRFRFRIPRTGRIALVARGTVVLDGRPQQRTWAIWASLNGQGQRSIELDGSNLLFSDPELSLLH